MSETVQSQDGAHDFDFFFGRWKIHNRRLVKRLEGCQDWDEFEATAECKPILGGLANIDDYFTDYWKDFVGMSLRFFNVETGQWRIYWADNRRTLGDMEAPVVGRFVDGVGIFEGPDTFNGKPIIVRYTWSDITPTSAQWAQAFSPDNGKTWETNWVNTFTRVE